MKETEAKTKRCCGGLGCGSPPHSLPELVIGQDGEEYYVQITTAMCIGSECMAWKPYNVVCTKCGKTPDQAGVPCDADNMAHSWQPAKNGDCGLVR